MESNRNERSVDVEVTTKANLESEEARSQAGPVFVALLAAILIGTFWMPWFNVLGIRMSGLQFAASSRSAFAAWLIPFCAALTIISVLARLPHRNAAQITGSLPILGLIYVGLNTGVATTFKILDAGVYVALLCGLFLILSPYLIRPTSK